MSTLQMIAAGPEPDAITLLERETRKLSLLRATMAVCERHERIAELTRQARAVPGCEAEAPPPSDYCTDRIIRPGGLESYPEPVRWWEMSPEQLASLCGPCRDRVALWRERSGLRRGMGGSTRALLAAYRRFMWGAR